MDVAASKICGRGSNGNNIGGEENSAVPAGELQQWRQWQWTHRQQQYLLRRQENWSRAQLQKQRQGILVMLMALATGAAVVKAPTGSNRQSVWICEATQKYKRLPDIDWFSLSEAEI